MSNEKDIHQLEKKYKTLENNQQEILQTLNNGLKSKATDTSKRVNKLDNKLNELLVALGGIEKVEQYEEKFNKILEVLGVVEKVNKLEGRFNKFYAAVGGAMFTIILTLITILWKVW